jgi:6-hydroxycyclohex-1-ene-1-carbonyl-CoA dehydrogenase
MSDDLPTHVTAWRFAPDTGAMEAALEKIELPVPPLGAGDALVKISGCGVCGTDIGFVYDHIPTISPPPLTLGHEISGVVVAGPPALRGKAVLVPTIMPCGRCELCQQGRSNRCLTQKMPGYSLAAQGGFASHIAVAADQLVEVPEQSTLPLSTLAVTTDAVATAYQACRRAEVTPGSKCLVIGATGGLGIYVTQWCKQLGASPVIAIGRHEDKLRMLTELGADLVINSSNLEPAMVRRAIWDYCRVRRVNPRASWKIFEVTGTATGQALGLELLAPASTLAVVGFGQQVNAVSISKLMALDAQIVGSWGSRREDVPEVLRAVLDGRIQVAPLVESKPLDEIQSVFAEHRRGRASIKRVVLIPS